MKIALATYGTRGDIQPILALALALRAAGHGVRLAAPPEFAGWVSRHGIEFHPLAFNFSAFVATVPAAHTPSSALRFVHFLRRLAARQFDELPEIFQGADLALGAALMLPAPTVAEALGLPYRYIAFCPQLLPSRFHPFWGLRNQRLPTWLNRLSWQASCRLDPFGFLTLVNRRRRALGLQSVRDVGRHYLGQAVIVAADRALAPVPPDVDTVYRQVGHLPLHSDEPLSPDLAEFLADGPPPLYFGFGSLSGSMPPHLAQMAIASARRASRKIILSAKRGETPGLQTDRDVFLSGDVPHPKLFPMVAAVIHHGGAGTTATVARAGRPQLIVPHLMDQFYWGHRIHRLGLGPRPIPRARLTLRRLDEAVGDCLRNDAYGRRAHEIAEILEPEDPLGATVAYIESEFAGPPRTTFNQEAD